MQERRTSYRCSPGPWGDIEYFFTFLDPPITFFESLVNRTTTEWVFLEKTLEQVDGILDSCGIPPDSLPPSTRLRAENGVLIRPSREFLESLEPARSQALQTQILKVSGDSARLNEFVIENGDFAAFTEGLDLPEELVRWTEERCFVLGRRTVFADTAFALSRIDDVNLRIRYLQALSRTRSIIARLRIGPDSDLEKISRWWSAGPNQLRAMPLLEAAMKTRGVDMVDLIHLLPPNPRRVLNTFPLERDCFGEFAPDCYWAAMNFFESTPSNRYLDDDLPRTYYFLDRFERVPKATRFGDVITVSDPDQNRFIHACIHIADDIVYTKNGSGKYFPYVLMRRDDMMTRYMPEGNISTDIFRLCDS